MDRTSLWLVICAGVASSFCIEAVQASSLTDDVAGELRQIILATIPNQQARPDNATVRDSGEALATFYRQRNYRPAWLTDSALSPQVADLLSCLAFAPAAGLSPETYHWVQLKALVAEVNPEAGTFAFAAPALLANLDLMLTEAFFLYGAHLAAGCIDPSTLGKEWLIEVCPPDLVRILEIALANGSVASALDRLDPQHPSYQRLRLAYHRYRHIQSTGGWDPIPGGPTLRPGDRGERIVCLRRRLAATGDFPASLAGDDDLFDDGVLKAVLRFQHRHGLSADGLVGNTTLAALNVPAAERLQQLALNMERWRCLPHHFGSRHLMVNIANFSLAIVEDDEIVSTMRVVVGKKDRPTPVLAGEMTYLELNPYWNIPARLVKADILPIAVSDPEYLRKQQIRVFCDRNHPAAELSIDAIDWANIAPANFTYRLRQDPGPQNALGRIKFMFPNKENVYLHDTPARHLFHYPQRSFSSGCVRVEKPLELAAYLLKDNPGWTIGRIQEAIACNTTVTLGLHEPIPVYLLYWTAWVEVDGSVNFREDIYGQDDLLLEALRRVEPFPLRALARGLLTLR